MLALVPGHREDAAAGAGGGLRSCYLIPPLWGQAQQVLAKRRFKHDKDESNHRESFNPQPPAADVMMLCLALNDLRSPRLRSDGSKKKKGSKLKSPQLPPQVSDQ